MLCGVPVSSVDPGELAGLAERERTRLALLTSRVRRTKFEVGDDF